MPRLLQNILAVLILISTCYSNSTEMKKSKLHIIEFKNRPMIGKHENKEIYLGGFSSLEVVSFQKNIIKFRTVTDRGPNGPAIENDPKLGKNLRPFLIQDYSPLIVDFELNDQNEIKNLKTENLFSVDGKKISGLPPIGQTPDNSDRVEQAVFNQKKLTFDVNGFDSEGLCTDLKGRTWISEEYHPSIAVFDTNKKLIKRFFPKIDFPEEYADRKINRGFEGLTCDQNYVYAMKQSPLPIKNAENKIVIRILRFDLKTLKAKDQFAYTLENEKVAKIGDITNDGLGNFYILEQNGKLKKKSKRFIFKTELTESKAISLTENPELWTQKQILKNSVSKKLVRDLSDGEISNIEKIEGLAVFENKIFMIADNDFGLVEDDKGQVTIDNTILPKLMWFELKDKK